MLFHEIVMLAATQNGIAAAGGSPAVASWPSLIGAEMMVNGDCGSATGWILGTGAVIAAGKMTLTAATSDTTNEGPDSNTLLEGATYRCVLTIDTVSLGTVQILLGAGAGTVRSTVATFSQDIVATDLAGEGRGWALVCTSATMQLDSFGVKSVGLLGIETDWAFTGDGFFNAVGAIAFDEGTGTASLTGAALTSFNAGVSNSTACDVTITSVFATGAISVSMKGGAPVTFTFDGSGDPVTEEVTSGTGSGFVIEVVTPPSGSFARIQITLAP